MAFAVSVLVVAISMAPLLGAGPDRVVPAINEIDKWQQVGQQPYEFTWTQRAEDPHTLVNFEDLAGWRLELYGGADGEFRRSREQLLWGEHTGKFFYSGTGEESRVQLTDIRWKQWWLIHRRPLSETAEQIV